jgi:hypothetical protein
MPTVTPSPSRHFWSVVMDEPAPSGQEELIPVPVVDNPTPGGIDPDNPAPTPKPAAFAASSVTGTHPAAPSDPGALPALSKFSYNNPFSGPASGTTSYLPPECRLPGCKATPSGQLHYSKPRKARTSKPKAKGPAPGVEDEGDIFRHYDPTSRTSNAHFNKAT